MTAPASGPVVAEEQSVPGGPSCPCGGDMWFLQFGYDSWVCRRNTRHWFRPGVERWSRDAEELAAGTA